MLTGTIYMHKNKINNKCYIGQTVKNPPEKRWQGKGSGYTNKNTRFFRAIQKYGWDNFEHIILETKIPLSELNHRENYYINLYNSINDGYNLIYSHEDNTAHSLSEEAKQHIKDGWTQELREKQSLRYMGDGNPMAGSHRINENAPNKKSIICINTQQIFPTIKMAIEWCGCSKPTMYRHLQGKSKNAGRHPVSNEKLQWKYYKGENI